MLVALAEELSNLIEMVGGPQFVYLLIEPLELLAAIEETVVREKASETLIKVAENLATEHVEKFFFPVIKRLSTADWFTPRTSACSLYAVCYPKVNAELQFELRKYVLVILSCLMVVGCILSCVLTKHLWFVVLQLRILAN